MYDKPQLGMAQVQAAMAAMLKETSKDPSRPVGIAIVDEAGSLLAYARMDKCWPAAQKFCIKKAYTAAIMRADSGAVAEQLKSLGVTVAEFGEPNLFPIQGAVVIRRPSDGAILGGIGVAGLPGGKLDEDVARIGLQALNL